MANLNKNQVFATELPGGHIQLVLSDPPTKDQIAGAMDFLCRQSSVSLNEQHEILSDMCRKLQERQLQIMNTQPGGTA